MMMTTTTRDTFDTKEAAKIACLGTADWDWGPVATWEGWVDYAYRHALDVGTTDESGYTDWQRWDHDDYLRSYLRSVGVDPNEFQL